MLQGVFYQNFHDCAIGHLPIYTRKRTLFHVPIFTTAHFLTVIILHISARRRHNRINLAPIHTAQGGGSFIVGYQQKDTVSGFNFVIPTFKAINGGAIHIQDIKIANATDWADNIQVLDEGGATVAAYFYATAEQSGFETDGWVSEDFTGLADVTFATGQSILIDTASPAVLTFAGQVSTEDTVVETVPGFNFVGNNTPVAVNIQDFTIVGATDWADNIQILDEGGATVSAYFYATAEQSGFEADGWVSEDFTTLADVTFEPGQGILIDTADVATVTIPGVNL